MEIMMRTKDLGEKIEFECKMEEINIDFLLSSMETMLGQYFKELLEAKSEHIPDEIIKLVISIHLAKVLAEASENTLVEDADEYRVSSDIRDKLEEIFKKEIK